MLNIYTIISSIILPLYLTYWVLDTISAGPVQWGCYLLGMVTIILLIIKKRNK